MSGWIKKAWGIALAVTAAISLAAPSAMATEEVEIVHEATGVPCPLGACHAHFVGEVELNAVIFGFEVHEGDCRIEMVYSPSSDGGDAIVDFEETEDTAGTHDSNCLHGPVVTAENLPWLGFSEEDAASTTGTTYLISIDPTEADECVGYTNVRMVESSETYRITFNNSRIGGSICELTGNLVLESTTVHINHP